MTPPYQVTTNTLSTTGTNVAMPMPASIPTGGGTLLTATMVVGPSITPTITGWSQLATVTVSSFYKLIAFGFKAVGGDTATIALGSSQAIMVVTQQIAGWCGVLSQVTAGTASSLSNPAAPDPPSLSMAFLADHLFIAAGYGGGASTTAPSNYTGLASVANANPSIIATAVRSMFAVSSENPGAFSSTGNTWAAMTIGVPGVLTPAALPRARIIRAANR